MKKSIFWLVLLLVFLSIASVAFAFWYFQPRKVLNVFILDKTVTDFTYRKHASFTWVLKSKRIITPKNNLYSTEKDYYGFMPVKSGGKEDYKIRSIRLFEVLTTSDELDMLYYTDNYGVFSNDIGNPNLNLKPHLLYGGLNQNDYLLLREMKRKKKLIITEYNLLGSPTSELIRQKTEDLFGFRTTGWTGCYFKSLKNVPENKIPSWIITIYQNNYKKTWDFKNPGIVIVNEAGNIIVLEENSGLNSAMPAIIPTKEASEEYNLPPLQKYGLWFDIIQTTKNNKIIAFFKLNATSSGKKTLTENGLSDSFPAIIEHSGDYSFYYFSGDFSDNQTVSWLPYFKGVPQIMNKIHTGSKGSSNEFFWNFYVPLLTKILDKHFYNN